MNFVPKISYGTGGAVDFELPPSQDFRNLNTKTSQRSAVSTNGTVQTQFNYNEETYRPRFTLVPEVIYQQFVTFYNSHGSKGLEFDYFFSNDELDFITVTLNKFSFKPTILFTSDTVGSFVYEWDMSFRRTI